MTTTLDPSFLRAVVLVCTFRGTAMQSAQAALLLIGLNGQTFTAADLPGEVCNGSRHLAGAATGSLIAIGLLEVVGRIKSPRADAKGRKLDLLQITPGKRGLVCAWLADRGYTTHSEQLELIA